jgi:hypothetical protein
MGEGPGRGMRAGAQDEDKEVVGVEVSAMGYLSPDLVFALNSGYISRYNVEWCP